MERSSKLTSTTQVKSSSAPTNLGRSSDAPHDEHLSEPKPDADADSTSAHSSLDSGNETGAQDSNVIPDLPIYLSKDVKSYSALIKKIAARLGLSLSVPKTQLQDAIYDVVQRDVLAPVSLPMATLLLQAVKNTWVHPSSAPTSLKWLDHMYQVQELSATFLYTYLKPNSVVVASSSRNRHHSTPPNRERKKIDAYGKHFYATGSLGIKDSNYLACMARFVYAVLEDFSTIIPCLPKKLRSQALQLQADGLTAVR